MSRETVAARKKRITKINKILAEIHPDAQTALSHRSPLQLLVATILSAQCTDERVNQVTKTLFKKYKTVGDYAVTDPEILQEDIRSTGFFRNKAKSIQGCCRALLENHNGKVPKSLEELVKLPGIGRKTANVVLGSAYGIVSGIVVDTHVSRLAQRMGFTKQKDPVKIEADLMKLLPEDEWIAFSHRMIFHGRRVCKARKPDCVNCAVGKLCPSFTP